MKDEQALKEISEELEVTIKNYSLGKQRLSEKVNELISNDLNKLISILYRMDVSETKLKQLLKENTNTDAGIIIADLMIERQAEKIRSRQQFSKRDDNIIDDEKW